MIYYDIVLIAVICVIIVDISGFMIEVKEMLGRWLKVSPDAIKLKPFDCSLCCTWWSGLIYLICVGEVSIFNIAFTLLVASMTPVIMNAIYTLKDNLLLLIDYFTPHYK